MTREIEARLKLSAIDRTAAAFKGVGNRMSEIDRKAKAINAASGKMAAVQTAAASRLAGLLAPAALAAGAAANFKTFADVDRRITRIGITADASAEAVAGIRPALSAIARETATPIDHVTSGLEDLVAQGKSLAEAMALLPSVTRTAQASGAEVKDIAATSGALVDSLKIGATEMQAAFDILVAGGKAGKFELKDMSQYLPSLAPMAAAVGLKGTAGLQRLTAMLQVVRAQTGNAGEAATNLTNVFQKMESDETAKNFKKMGVDLRTEMSKARKEGKDLTEVFLDLSEKALKGDLSKVPQLFHDMQMAGGMRALLSQRDALRKLQAELRNVDGATMKDFAKVSDDARASVDRLANSWDRFVVNAGRSISNAGLPQLLDKLSDVMDRQARIVEAEQRQKGGGKEEYVKQAVADGMTRDQAEEVWSYHAGGKTSADLAKEKAAARAKAAATAADLEPARRAVESAKSGVTTIGGYRSQLGERNLRQAEERLRRAESAAMEIGLDGSSRYAPVVDRARLAAGEARRYRPAPEVYPVPKPRPEPGAEIFPIPRPRPEDGAAAIAPAMGAMVAEIDRQGTEAVAKAESIWSQIASIFARPITPNIQAPRAPALDTGRSFAGGAFTGAP